MSTAAPKSSPLVNRVEPKQRKQPARVVTDFDAVLHEDMLPQKQCEGQNHQVNWHSDDGLGR
jgi:hypothetical protein